MARAARDRIMAILVVAVLNAVVPAPAQEDAARNGRDSGATEARQVPEALNFANGLLRDRRYDLAAEEYEKFLKTDPPAGDEADARFGLATARLYLGRYKEARAQFEAFLEKAP